MLARIKSALGDSPIRMFLVAFGVAAIFIVAAVYVYRTQVSPRLDPSYVPNKEFAGGRMDEGPAVFFFYTTWCPHCKTARPIWDEFKSQMKGKKVNGQEVTFVEVDCDKDKALADRYKVEGYPTIKLATGDKVVEYDAKPDIKSLHQFLETSL
jgi:thiol-disulfide isomerase/thioredoxin